MSSADPRDPHMGSPGSLYRADSWTDEFDWWVERNVPVILAWTLQDSRILDYRTDACVASTRMSFRSVRYIRYAYMNRTNLRMLIRKSNSNQKRHTHVHPNAGEPIRFSFTPTTTGTDELTDRLTAPIYYTFSVLCSTIYRRSGSSHSVRYRIPHIGIIPPTRRALL